MLTLARRGRFLSDSLEHLIALRTGGEQQTLGERAIGDHRDLIRLVVALDVALDSARLAAMPVHEFVDLMVQS